MRQYLGEAGTGWPSQGLTLQRRAHDPFTPPVVGSSSPHRRPFSLVPVTLVSFISVVMFNKQTRPIFPNLALRWHQSGHGAVTPGPHSTGQAARSSQASRLLCDRASSPGFPDLPLRPRTAFIHPPRTPEGRRYFLLTFPLELLICKVKLFSE